MCTKISICNALDTYTYHYTYIPKSVKTRQLTSRFSTVAWPSVPGSNSLNLSHNMLVGMFDYLKFSYDNAENPRALRKRRLWSFVLLSGTNTTRKSRIWTSYTSKNSLAQYRPGGKSCILNALTLSDRVNLFTLPQGFSQLVHSLNYHWKNYVHSCVVIKILS